MSIVSRLHGLLDTELSTQLRFTFTIDENLTRPGDRGIRPGDRIRFSVRLCNHSSLPLRSVQPPSLVVILGEKLTDFVTDAESQIIK